MFKLIMGLILGVIAVIAAVKYGVMEGSITLLFQNQSIHLPLWMAICGLLLGLLFVWAVFALIGRLLTLPERWRAWRLGRQRQNAYRETEQGYLAMAEERWEDAEKHLINAVPYVETPVSHYLSAAKAAQEQGADERRDAYLQQSAVLGSKGEQVPIKLTQVSLLLKNGEYEKSLLGLLQLRQVAPRHPVVLKLLKQVYMQTGHWGDLRALLPDLQKRKVCTAPQIQHLELKTLDELFWEAEQKEGIEACHQLWQSCSKALRHTPALVLTYANILLRHHGAVEAESILRATLKQEWHEGLIALYGKISGGDVGKQLAFAESWLACHENSAALLLTCGRLSLINQLWGKAQRYFDASLAIEKNTETYAELGRLLEYLNKPELSHECFRQGLLLESKKVEV